MKNAVRLLEKKSWLFFKKKRFTSFREAFFFFARRAKIFEKSVFLPRSQQIFSRWSFLKKNALLEFSSSFRGKKTANKNFRAVLFFVLYGKCLKKLENNAVVR